MKRMRQLRNPARRTGAWLIPALICCCLFLSIPPQPASGTTITGLTKTTLPDGTVVNRLPNGDTLTIRGNGTEFITRRDGTTVSVDKYSGVKTNTTPDGTTTYSYPGGLTITHSKDTRVVKRPDGVTVTTTTTVEGGFLKTTQTMTYPDGRTVVERGGTTTTTYPNGKTVTKQPDGTTVTTYPEGTSVTKQPDGTTITKHPDGRTVTRKPDGTKTTEKPVRQPAQPSTPTLNSPRPGAPPALNVPPLQQTRPAPATPLTGQSSTPLPATTVPASGAKLSPPSPPSQGEAPAQTAEFPKETLLPDGTRKLTYADGSTVTIYRDGKKLTTYPNGYTDLQYPNGTGVTTYPDGRSVHHGPGGVKHITEPDGTRTTVYPDGATVTVDPKGVRTAREPNGKTQTDFPDGRSVTTYPDGRTATYDPTTGTTTFTAPDGKTTSIPSPLPPPTGPVTGSAPPRVQVQPLQLPQPATGGVQLTLPSQGSSGPGQTPSAPGSGTAPQKPLQSSNFQIRLGGLQTSKVTTLSPPIQSAKTSTPSPSPPPRAIGVVPRSVDGEQPRVPAPPPVLQVDDVLEFRSPTGEAFPLHPGAYHVVEQEGDLQLISVDDSQTGTFRLATESSSYEGNLEESIMLWLPGEQSDEHLLLLLGPDGQGLHTIGTGIGIATRGAGGLQSLRQFLLPGGGILRLAPSPLRVSGTGTPQGRMPSTVPQPPISRRVMLCAPRSNPPAPRSDQGRPGDDECRDMNPGALHVVVGNMLGLRSQGIAEDRTGADGSTAPPPSGPAAQRTPNPPSGRSPTPPIVPRGMDSHGDKTGTPK